MRKDVDYSILDKKLFREFSQRGRQILVFGPTPSVKTDRVLDILRQLQRKYGTSIIRVAMTDATDNLAFIASVTRQLNLGKTSKWRITENFTEMNEFSNLVEFLLKTNTILVIENMENLPDKALSLRMRLAEMAKNLSDEAINYPESYAKIIFTGVEETAAQLWGDVQSLKGRLATINVKIMG